MRGCRGNLSDIPTRDGAHTMMMVQPTGAYLGVLGVKLCIWLVGELSSPSQKASSQVIDFSKGDCTSQDRSACMGIARVDAQPDPWPTIRGPSTAKAAACPLFSNLKKQFGKPMGCEEFERCGGYIRCRERTSGRGNETDLQVEVSISSSWHTSVAAVP